MHIVQISNDIDIMTGRFGAEPLERQVAYSEELEVQQPGSCMTTIIISARRHASKSVGTHSFIVLTGFGRHSFQLFLELRRLHTRNPISVISCQRPYWEAWVVLVFAWMQGIRVVGQIHVDIFSPKAKSVMFSGLHRQLVYQCMIWGLPYFHRLRVVGTAIERSIRSRRLNFNVETIPVGMAITDRDEPSGVQRSRQVLFVGRFAREKDLFAWLQVCAIIAKNDCETRFVLVGGGELENELKEYASSLGITKRVEFRGYVDNAELPSIYAEASVFLLTSSFEGFGRVLVEASAFGCVCVAPRMAGVEDVIEHGDTGFLAERGVDEIVVMAEYCQLLLNTPRLQSAMGANARMKVRVDFNTKVLRQKYIRLLCREGSPAKGCQLPVRRRTLRRVRSVINGPYSLCRNLEYEAIEGIALRGRVLDIGGGAKNSYVHLFQTDGQLVESVNIDPKMEPTLVHDLNEPLPFGDAEFDTVISMNTFEHIRNDQVAIRESVRVLRPGGHIYISVPFMYRVHGSPFDFHRHTSQWWSEFLIECGVDSVSLTIDPLVWDRLATSFSFFGSSRLGRGVRVLLALPAAIRDGLWGGSRRLKDSSRVTRIADYAVGYFIHGQKCE